MPTKFRLMASHIRPVVLCMLFFQACTFHVAAQTHPRLPEWMKGDFTDDYGIMYNVSDSLFSMGKSAKFNILSWNADEKYLLAQNDTMNKSEKGLYTRIDYMNFSGMEPYLWGFCFTVYNATTRQQALEAAQADRANPKKGCSGYPFSRMRRSEK